MSFIKTTFMNLILLVGGVVVGTMLFEGGLRLFSPFDMRIKGDEINLNYNGRMEIPAPDAKKLDSLIIHSRNSIGLRGPNPPNYFDNHITIFAVGGSTTEGFYISDGETWPEVLGDKLKNNFDDIWVNNAGLDGHSTFGHILLMQQHLIQFKPKIAMFLIGINDLAKAEASNYDTYIIPNASIAPQTTKGKIHHWLGRNSELYALYLNIRRSLTASSGKLGHSEINFAKVNSIEISDSELNAYVAKHSQYRAAFKERLKKLAELSRQNGIDPILITQPAVYGFGIDPVTGLDLAKMAVKPPKENGRVAWELLESYNEVTREFAKKQEIFLVDLAREMPKDTTHFYDNYHFTADGSAVVAGIIAKSLCPYLANQYPEHVEEPCR